MNTEKKPIKGFSKFTRESRLKLLAEWMNEDVAAILDEFLHENHQYQSTFSEFSENYLSNYILPFGVVPNVLINDRLYLVPMVIEESSVVAAASRSAGFWAANGGFRTEILGSIKKGQVHFIWKGDKAFLEREFAVLKPQFFSQTESITEGMRKRGGGITYIELTDLTAKLEGYYQIDVSFSTADAMGANFINTCLEKIASVLQSHFEKLNSEFKPEVIMSILSNHTPECIVKCTVECDIEALAPFSGSYTPDEFSQRFYLAVKMAQVNVSRAVTHNKGIYNGIDGVVLATGNDWRAVEAAGHAFAADEGQYGALSEIAIENNHFQYSITVPLAVGTVGGLTQTHPLAKLALNMLGNPNANELMQIMAALGMANNFSAISSLVTSGIQKGHMKMHLSNILTQLSATADEKITAQEYFTDKTISYSSVQNYLINLRQNG